MTEPDLRCCWCDATDLLLDDQDVAVVNPQVDFAHTVYRCLQCEQLSAVARWRSQYYVYRALRYARPFRAPLYALVYAVACAWCGRADRIEPEEINATVGNPASQRHQYDIYACHACQRYTAVSYFGQVFAYPATQDERYTSMYYLEFDDE